MAFGDNGPRKKSFFERLTVLVVLIMLLVTVGALIFKQSQLSFKTLSSVFLCMSEILWSEIKLEHSIQIRKREYK